MPIRIRSARKAPRTEGAELDPAARDAANKARAGSAKLRLALLLYGAKHGLPNLSPQQCLAALRLPAKGRKGPGGKGRARAAAVGGEGRRHGTRG